MGDSLGNVIQGHNDTLPVTLDDMIYHTRCVRRTVQQALVIGDMPFGSFQVNAEATVRNAVRLVQEGGAEAVKLEGATPTTLRAVRQLTQNGIPVVGHVGLTPQSVNAIGGFRKQGKDADSASRSSREAQQLEKAGAFAIVVECVPAELTTRIMAALKDALLIGIGAGNNCDGQILVSHDLFGMLDHSPSFAPRYTDFADQAHDVLQRYVADVQIPVQNQNLRTA